MFFFLDTTVTFRISGIKLGYCLSVGLGIIFGRTKLNADISNTSELLPTANGP